MSALTIPAANTLVVLSGGGAKIFAEVKVQFTISVSTTKIEPNSTLDLRQSNEQFKIFSTATVPQWRRVGHLARIAIDEDEILVLCAQLNSIMSFVEQLAEVNVDDVEPMTSVTPMAMKMREDKVTDGGIPDAIIANAPAHEDHFFVVPKVVE
jgi:aspartyl-tRNA(Asn)/glutamyl-tRNA(Gln) amidotransferase subunit C